MYKVLSDSVLMQDAIAKIRDKATPSPVFRNNLKRIGRYLAYEVSKAMEQKPIKVETPLEVTDGFTFKHEIVILSILRAALPMTNAVFEEFDEGSLGLSSASRSNMIEENGRSFEIESTYSKIPPINGKIVIIVDPMLATGSTIRYLLGSISNSGEVPAKIFVLCAIASEFGVTQLEKDYPLVDIYTAAVDKKLNDHGYIVPGLGDAGDRAFNTPHL